MKEKDKNNTGYLRIYRNVLTGETVCFSDRIIKADKIVQKGILEGKYVER